jgi:glutamate synthase domain-containing protein 2
MNYGTPNASSVTGTKNRVPDTSPYSGICSACLDGCPGLCEIGKSTFRGREVLYPEPFGKVTAGAVKVYPVDYSHLNIQGTCVGAVGIEANSNHALFTKVSTEVEIGTNHRIKLKVPILTGALGSTKIAQDNWEGMAIGGAISGIIVVIGENIVGMDPDAKFRKGKVIKSPELERRVKTFQKWHEGYGAVLLQQNIEDGRLGSPEYAIDKLGVKCIELKWGQGAKDIGGEVKLKSIDRALELKKKGYVIIPDPEDPVVVKAFREGAFEEFERHSKLGMVEYDSFLNSAEHLREIGAKFVSLKTGAFRIADLARALRFASDARIDLLTIDGAGGGTGMSPWRMMNEWGIPTIYLQSLAYTFAKELKAKGKHVPDIAIAGGFSLEDHIFKAIALGAPYFKAVCMGRATMIPAMVGKNIQQWLRQKKLPPEIKKYGKSVETIFASAETLKSRYGKKYTGLPASAIGMYTFCDRLQFGLQQLMAGARKFAIKHLDRSDLVSLTREAAQVTAIPYIMESDLKEARNILFGKI